MAEATTMRLEDWLDDLCVRFIINLPREELESVERICFQVEEAQWFYEDFIRPLDPNLPSMSLRQFAFRIFQHCPLMSEWSHHHHSAAFSEFLAYKTRVPVRGAILLNQDMDEIVLVKGWKKGANWSFPRGKINKDERDLDCAIREVYEETGFDLKTAGLVNDEEKLKYIEIPMREQNMRLYVVRGIPKDTYFEPRTRKEISKIEWYKLSELPTLKKSKQVGLGGQNINGNANKFYMVAPFLGPLKKWISQQRKLDIEKAPTQAGNMAEGEAPGQGPEPVNGDALRTSGLIERQFPSDLPEVSNPQDPSAQMKRLLNIGAFPQTPHVPPIPQHGLPDSSKGNALLALLRQGSEGLGSEPLGTGSPAPVSFHPDKGSSQPLPQSFNWQSNTSVQNSAQGLRQPPIGPPHVQPYHGNVPNPVQVGNGFNQRYQSWSDNRSYPAPPKQYQTPSTNQYPVYQSNTSQDALRNHPQGPVQFPRHPTALEAPAVSSTRKPRQTPAPYQRTGDPQFAQGTQSANADAPSVPPASKLPMPKLTSHSLALLNVLKNDNAKGQEPAAPELPSQPEVQRRAKDDEKSHHQSDLLNLLKHRPSSSGNTAREIQPAHAELATSSTPLPATSKVEPVKILKKEYPIAPAQSTPRGSASEHKDTSHKNDATLAGPLNLPNFEAAKTSRKQVAAAKNANKEPKRAKPPNITILPRPNQPKEDTPGTAPAAESASSPPARNIKLADLAKPSQPKILRRPEKGNLEACLPTHTVAVSAFSQPNREDSASEQKEETKPVTYDRRPSQPTAQKEALLSLFGKGGGTAAIPRSPEEHNNEAVSPPLTSPPRSNVISPLPSSSPPGPRARDQQQIQHSASKTTSPEATSESTTKDRGKVTSPVDKADKAFLLGYLEGVAKGNR